LRIWKGQGTAARPSSFLVEKKSGTDGESDNKKQMLLTIVSTSRKKNDDRLGGQITRGTET